MRKSRAKKKSKIRLLPHTVSNYIPFFMVIRYSFFLVAFFIASLSWKPISWGRDIIQHTTDCSHGSNQHRYTQISSKFHILACFPNMVMPSKYGHTSKFVQLPNMGIFPNMVMVLKYGHVLQTNLVFSSYCHTFEMSQKAWISKYWHIVHVWSYRFD